MGLIASPGMRRAHFALSDPDGHGADGIFYRERTFLLPCPDPDCRIRMPKRLISGSSTGVMNCGSRGVRTIYPVFRSADIIGTTASAFYFTLRNGGRRNGGREAPCPPPLLRRSLPENQKVENPGRSADHKIISFALKDLISSNSVVVFNSREAGTQTPTLAIT